MKKLTDFQLTAGLMGVYSLAWPLSSVAPCKINKQTKPKPPEQNRNLNMMFRFNTGGILRFQEVNEPIDSFIYQTIPVL